RKRAGARADRKSVDRASPSDRDQTVGRGKAALGGEAERNRTGAGQAANGSPANSSRADRTRDFAATYGRKVTRDGRGSQESSVRATTIPCPQSAARRQTPPVRTQTDRSRTRRQP